VLSLGDNTIDTCSEDEGEEVEVDSGSHFGPLVNPEDLPWWRPEWNDPRLDDVAFSDRAEAILAGLVAAWSDGDEQQVNAAPLQKFGRTVSTKWPGVWLTRRKLRALTKHTHNMVRHEVVREFLINFLLEWFEGLEQKKQSHLGMPRMLTVASAMGWSEAEILIKWPRPANNAARLPTKHHHVTWVEFVGYILEKQFGHAVPPEEDPEEQQDEPTKDEYLEVLPLSQMVTTASGVNKFRSRMIQKVRSKPKLAPADLLPQSRPNPDVTASADSIDAVDMLALKNQIRDLTSRLHEVEHQPPVMQQAAEPAGARGSPEEGRAASCMCVIS